ncbi:hypothetical protein ACIBVL_06975 [Streptomyces sp. NPDC049687]|uniref:hypothetical protein n=1 Tax=Streptomyces sp. NPDC049687 TaxID=3365596 RepID=UPI0037922A79
MLWVAVLLLPSLSALLALMDRVEDQLLAPATARRRHAARRRHLYLIGGTTAVRAGATDGPAHRAGPAEARSAHSGEPAKAQPAPSGRAAEALAADAGSAADHEGRPSGARAA